MEFRIQCPSCRRVLTAPRLMCPYCGTDLRPLLRLRARLELSFRDVLARLRGVLVKPTETMRQIAAVPDMLGPALLILAASLLLSLRVAAWLPLTALPLALTIIISLFLLLACWLVVSWLVNSVCRLVGGAGTFDQTASVLGYSATPLVIGLLLTEPLIRTPPLSRVVLTPFAAWFIVLALIGLRDAHGLSLARLILLCIILGAAGGLLLWA